MGQHLKVLAIDGGGVRGLIPAVVLAEIEQRTGRPIADQFDLIAGTSSGGILALALSMPDPDDPSRPAFTAEQLLRIYERQVRAVFTARLGERVRTMNGYLGPKYPGHQLDRVLLDFFGPCTLADARVPVAVSSYDANRGTPFFFRSWADAHARHPMWMAARATAAAPTFFSPLRMGDATLIDGGIVANNSALYGFAELRMKEAWEGRDPDIKVVSLGTGDIELGLSPETLVRWGKLGWLPHFIEVILGGTSDLTMVHTWQLIGRGHYWRLSPPLPRQHAALDNIHPRNLRALKHAAHKMVREGSGRLKIERIVAALNDEPGVRR